MAILKTITINGGIPVDDAFIKVIEVRKRIDQVRIDLVAFKDAQSSQTDNDIRDFSNREIVNHTEKAFVKYFSEEALKKQGASLFKNAYNYIKTLSKYSGAVDVGN